MNPATVSSQRPARSSNWRVNSSPIKSLEGAYILRALRKVAGAIGLPASYKIRFTTDSKLSSFDSDTDQIQIGAGDLFKQAPIPPDKLDALVGRTLHEVTHHTINTAGVWASCLHKVPQSERPLFKAFVSIGEDIVIAEKLTSNANLKDYYDAAMAIALKGRREPLANSLLEIWIEYAIAGNLLTLMQIPFEMAAEMDELIDLTKKLRQPMDRFTGTRIRAELYIASWGIVKEIILHPPELPDAPSSGMGAPPEEGEDGIQMDFQGPIHKGPSDEKGPKQDVTTPLDSSSAPIDRNLAREIEEAMVSDTEDITQQIYDEFKDAGFTPSSRGFLITRKKETRTIIVRPDPGLCRKLEQVLVIRKRLQSRTMHGEINGKLDMRKLYRTQTDMLMFKLKYRFPEGFPETAILVDMSGSMSGEQAEEVIVAATSLATVVKCQVWAYAQNSSEIAITRLDEGIITHGARPEGNTPSGVALVAVGNILKRGGLIIHLTDGEHNVEFGPAEAMQLLNKKGISAIHLLWGDKEGPYAGLNYRILKGGLAEFPEALHQILIEQLRLDRMGRK